MTYQEDKRQIREILFGSELVTEINDISSIGHGNNNRTYVVSSEDKKYFAKFYYFADSDKRNRLDNEFNFLNYAKEKNIGYVPEAILRQDSLNLGIFEYIEGKKFQKEDLDKENIMYGANFFSLLNFPRNLVDTKKLRYASEAFLDLDEYLAIIDNKIILLSEASRINKEKQLTKFLKDLKSIWKETKISILKEGTFLSDNKSLCVSPSDFGFHNALITPKGLYFLDFEYAGIDDSAKFISDFFIQPEIQVPIKYFEEFSHIALDIFPDQGIQLERTKKLFSMFQVKWCCIILNEFLPKVAERRIFSNPKLNIEDSKKRQLKKAQTLLLGIN